MRAARFFPFLDTLKTYTTRDFRADFMAALTVTPMAIPQPWPTPLLPGYTRNTAFTPVCCR